MKKRVIFLTSLLISSFLTTPAYASVKSDVYFIQPDSSALYRLESKDGSLIARPAGNSEKASQRFIITKLSDGTYKIGTGETGGASVVTGDIVRRYERGDNQKWNIVENSDNTYSFLNIETNKYLTYNGGMKAISETNKASKFILKPIREGTKYTVRFSDGLGNNTYVMVNKGGTATSPKNPTRAGYVFDGWDKDLTNIQSSMSVNAKWKKDASYTVTFTDGFGKTLSKQTVKDGDNAQKPANPTKEGYTFTGWSGTYNNIKKDTVVSAQWKINTYEVTFTNGAGVILKKDKVEHEKSAIAPQTPTREGYSFSGWDKDFDKVTGNMTINAKWSQTPSYIVTFISDGKTIKTDTVKEGGKAVAPTIPTKTGYAFDGWDKSFDKIAGNLTVNAKWKINTYTVIFKDGDKILSTQKAEYGKAAKAPTNPTKVGYTFDGWSEGFSNIQRDTIITAKWKTSTYDVTFTDGMGNILKKEKVENGKSATAPKNPTREGYSFDGWDKSFDKTTGNLTINAKWKANTYTVTFKDGDKTLSTQKVEYGKSATLPSNPTKAGYFFDGWSGIYTNIKKDTVVTAKWRTNSYDVIFTNGLGVVLKKEKVDYGKGATAPSSPTREGYSFAGWDKIFSKITDNTTINAKWSTNTYTVTFKDGDKVLSTQKIEYGKAAKAPAVPTKTGYIFGGWDKSYNKIKSNTTITPKWVAKTVKVNFYFDGKTYSETYTYGKANQTFGMNTSAKTDQFGTWSRTGYDLLGWSHDKNATVKTYNTYSGVADAWINDKAGEVNLYAVWKPKTYTVTFEDGNGKVLKTQSVEYGKAATAPNVPARDKYVRDGWDKTFNNITENTTVKAKWIYFALSKEEETINVGDKYKIPVYSTATPSFLSLAPDYASVDKEGYITAKKAGGTSIKIYVGKAEKIFKINIQDFKFPFSEKMICVGDIEKIYAGKGFYKSSDISVATVSQDGTIKGNKSGTAIINATYNGKTISYKLTVNPLNFTLPTEKTIYVGDTYKPEGISERPITYSVGDSKYATIDNNGIVKATKSGIVTLYAKSNGVTKACRLTIKEISLTIKNNSSTIYLGEKAKLEATTNPVRKVTYKSGDEKIATIDQNGNITPKKTGTVTISATAEGITKSTTYYVKDINMSFITKYKKVRLGETFKNVVSIFPSRNVTYSSANTDIATVAQDGTVTPKKVGKTIITASYGKYSASYNLEVQEKKVEMEDVSSALYLGEPLKIKISNATKIVSSDTTVATVSADGTITPKKTGNFKITASNASSSEQKNFIIYDSAPNINSISISGNGKYLYADGFSSNVITTKTTGTALNNRFKLVKEGGLYSIRSGLGDGTKTLTDVSGKLQLKEYTGATSQKWSIVRRRAGWIFYNPTTKRYINMSGLTTIKTALTTSRVSEPIVASLTPKKPADGWYTFTEKATGKNLDIPNAKDTNGLKAILYQKNTANAQKFYIKNVGGYDYKILTSNKKALDIDNGKVGGSLLQWSDAGSLNQKWRFFYANGGYILMNMMNGQILKASGSNFISADFPASYFTLTSTTDPSYGNPPSGWVEIVPKNNTGVRFDVANNDAHDDTNIGLWTKNGNNAQRYYIRGIGGGKYKIATGSTFRKRYLTVDGSNVKQMNESESLLQQWYIYKTSDGLYEFKNVYNNKCLDIPNGNAKAGANVQVYADNDTAAQRFNIVSTSAPTGSAYYPITYKRKWNYTVRDDLTSTQKAVFDEALKNLNTDKTALEIGKGQVANKGEAERIINALENQYYYQVVKYSDNTPKTGVGINESYSYNSTNKSIIINAKKCRKAFQDTKAIENLVQSVSKSIFKKGMTEKQAISAANEWIRKNLTYKIHHNLNYIVTKREAECEGYSRLFELLMDIAGVDCKYVSGYASPFTKNDGHGWNYINAEDTWYYIDVTWNDSSPINQYYLTTKLWSDHREKTKYYNY